MDLQDRSTAGAVASAFPQQKTETGDASGSVSGTVLDTTGATISGATVTVTQTDTGRQFKVITNRSGDYVFPSLAPARYSVRITASGFSTFEKSDVVIDANQSLNVGARLKIGAMTAAVQVTATIASYAALDSSSATRTNTPLIEVPQSVQTITRTLIEDQDRRTLGEALLNVSGVTPTKPEEALFTGPIVRGFPAEIYQDGLPVFGMEAASDPTTLVGTEKIDVVKGPTSSVYGGGLGAPLGGLINVESKRPEARAAGFVALRGGSYSTLDPYADLNFPLGSKVAARITGEYQKNGSWIEQVEGDRWSAQPSISFKLAPNTELLAQGEYNQRSQLEYSGIPAAQALADQIDRNAFPGATIGQPRTTLDNRLVTTELRHRFTDDLRLTTTARYYVSSITEYGSFADPDFGPPDPDTPTTYPIFTIYLPSSVKEGTLDANLLANIPLLGGRHELLGGVNYDHVNFFGGVGFDGVPVGNLDLAKPAYNVSYGTAPAVSGTETDRYQTVAGYIQDQASYKRLHLTGSLRYTQLEFREREPGTDKTYRRVTPRVGATVDLVHGVAPYAGYSTGFRGSFAFFGTQPPKPETSRNLEGGLKLALTKVGLSGTIAAFDQTRENVPTPDPNNPLFSIQTGQQRARGLETDLAWEPIHSFSVIGNYAYTEAAVTQDNVIPVGNKLSRVPKHSGRVAARYGVLNGAAKGLSFGAGITAFSARADTLPNTVSVPGYAAIDAQAAYDFGRYTLEGSAVNLAGRKAFDPYEYLGFAVVIPTQPRSAFGTLKIHF